MGGVKRFRAASWVVPIPPCCLVLVEVRRPGSACGRRIVYSVWGVVLTFCRNGGRGANRQLRRAESEIEAACLHRSRQRLIAVSW
jgi:hypothetical protein